MMRQVNHIATFLLICLLSLTACKSGKNDMSREELMKRGGEEVDLRLLVGEVISDTIVMNKLQKLGYPIPKKFDKQTGDDMYSYYFRDARMRFTFDETKDTVMYVDYYPLNAQIKNPPKSAKLRKSLNSYKKKNRIFPFDVGVAYNFKLGDVPKNKIGIQQSKREQEEYVSAYFADKHVACFFNTQNPQDISAPVYFVRYYNRPVSVPSLEPCRPSIHQLIGVKANANSIEIMKFMNYLGYSTLYSENIQTVNDCQFKSNKKARYNSYKKQLSRVRKTVKDTTLYDYQLVVDTFRRQAPSTARYLANYQFESMHESKNQSVWHANGIAYKMHLEPYTEETATALTMLRTMPIEFTKTVLEGKSYQLSLTRDELNRVLTYQEISLVNEQHWVYILDFPDWHVTIYRHAEDLFSIDSIAINRPGGKWIREPYSMVMQANGNNMVIDTSKDQWIMVMKDGAPFWFDDLEGLNLVLQDKNYRMGKTNYAKDRNLQFYCECPELGARFYFLGTQMHNLKSKIGKIVFIEETSVN